MPILLDYTPIVNRCRKLASTGRAIFQSYNNALLSVLGGATKSVAFAPVLAMLVDAGWITSTNDLRTVIHRETSLIADAIDRPFVNAVFRQKACNEHPLTGPFLGGTVYSAAMTSDFITQIERVIRQTIAATGDPPSGFYYLPVVKNAEWSQHKPVWKCKLVRFDGGTAYTSTANSTQEIDFDPCDAMYRIRAEYSQVWGGVSTSAISFSQSASMYVNSDLWSNLEKMSDLFSYFHSLISQYVSPNPRTIEIRNVSSISLTNSYDDQPALFEPNVVTIEMRPQISFILNNKILESMRPHTNDWVDVTSPLKRLTFTVNVKHV